MTSLPSLFYFFNFHQIFQTKSSNNNILQQKHTIQSTPYNLLPPTELKRHRLPPNCFRENALDKFSRFKSPLIWGIFRVTYRPFYRLQRWPKYMQSKTHCQAFFRLFFRTQMPFLHGVLSILDTVFQPPNLVAKRCGFFVFFLGYSLLQTGFQCNDLLFDQIVVSRS